MALTVSSGTKRFLSSILSSLVAVRRSFLRVSSFFWVSTNLEVSFLMSYYFSLK